MFALATNGKAIVLTKHSDSRHSTSDVLSSLQYSTPSHCRLVGRHRPSWHFLLAFTRHSDNAADAHNGSDKRQNKTV